MSWYTAQCGMFMDNYHSMSVTCGWCTPLTLCSSYFSSFPNGPEDGIPPFYTRKLAQAKCPRSLLISDGARLRPHVFLQMLCCLHKVPITGPFTAQCPHMTAKGIQNLPPGNWPTRAQVGEMPWEAVLLKSPYCCQAQSIPPRLPK